MKSMHRAGALALAVILSGMATAQTPSPTPTQSAKERFDAAKAAYEKNMGYYTNAAIDLRKAIATNSSMACPNANLVVVALGTAQRELKTMIDLIEAAHQDATPWRKDYDDNAEQLTLRRASLQKSGCG